MKLILSPRKPRNPFATAARLRRAGAHRSGHAALRQQAGRELRREIERLRPSP
ncbi:MAG: hypothetical protein KF863_03280 [Rubrivivax sp.]|mgnify:CR=1 FL=1|nr:hypothetical protein [Rubrivivax sp.]